jgi:hypothetical protein
MGLARSSLFGFATTVTAERAAMGVPAKAARGGGYRILAASTLSAPDLTREYGLGGPPYTYYQ